jgi:dihydroorotate dehydrogenase (NAD+) catalytic subunit
VADLSTRIGSLKLRNPFIGASGCFGYGVEYSTAVDLSSLGGVAVKGLFLSERQGHPPPRIVETPAGMLNAIGLQGIGVHRFVAEKLPELRKLGATTIVNVCGSTIDEYCEVSRVLSDHEGVAAIELNISCPNIKEGGIQFGCSLHGTHDVVSAVRKVTKLPLIPKLTPNVTDVASFARASEEAGADAVSLVNTFLAMAIDPETRTPKLSNGLGHPSDRRADGLGMLPGRQASDHRHGRHRHHQRCARVHHRGRVGRPGGHSQLRRPVDLDETHRRAR